MTVSAYTPLSYSTNGSLVIFPVTFDFFDTSDIVVKLRTTSTGADTLLTEGLHYDVTGLTGSDPYTGGNVVAVETYDSGFTLSITRSTTQTQTTDLKQSGPLPSDDIEDSLDRLTMMSQELQEQSDRSLKFPVSDSPSLSGTIDNSVDRASGFMGFDDNGEPSVASSVAPSTATVTSFMETVLDDSNAAAALATLHGRPVYNIQAYGATGDGTTNDTEAIQAAMDACPNYGTVFFPNTTVVGGTEVTAIYAISGTGAAAALTLDKQLMLKGDTSHTELRMIGGTGPMISASVNLAFGGFRDLHLDGEGIASECLLLKEINSRVDIDNCNFGKVATDGFCIRTTVTHVYGIVQNCLFSPRGSLNTVPEAAMQFVCDGATTKLLIQNCHFDVQGNYAIKFINTATTGGMITIDACRFEREAEDFAEAEVTVPSLYFGFAGTSGTTVVISDCKHAPGTNGGTFIEDAGTKYPVYYFENNNLSGLDFLFQKTLAGSLRDVDTVDNVVSLTGTINKQHYIFNTGPFGGTAGVTFVTPADTDAEKTTFALRNDKQFVAYGAVIPLSGAYVAGDRVFKPGPTAGTPVGWTCLTAGSPGTWMPMATSPGAVAKTAQYDVTAADNGTRYRNDETAGAAKEFDLPAAVIGMRYHFTRDSASYAVRVDPSGTNIIKGGTAGQYLSLDTDGASATLECMTALEWEITASHGTLSYA